MLLSYVAVIERNADGRFFAHLPDLPGATAAGASAGEALRNLSDIAADHLADLANDGEEVPVPTDFDLIARDPEVDEYARALVTVEAPGRTVKISLSIDEGLLARVDHAASKAGLTRSGFFAEACNQRLRQELIASPLITKAPAAGGREALILNWPFDPQVQPRIMGKYEPLGKHVQTVITTNRSPEDDDEMVVLGAMPLRAFLRDSTTGEFKRKSAKDKARGAGRKGS